MAKILNRKQIVDQFVNKEWFLLTKKPDVWPLPIWYKFKLGSFSEKYKRIYSVCIPWICFFDDNNVEAYIRGREYKLVIQVATKILYSKQKFDSHLAKTEKLCTEVQKLMEKFNELHWENFSNEELYSLYITIINEQVDSFIYGFITWYAQILEYDAQLIVNNHNQELSKMNISPEEALSIVIVPEEQTIYQKKNKILNKLSKEYKKVLNCYKSEKFLASHYPKLYQKIENFINKYTWVDFNYNGPVLDYKILIKQLLELQNIKQNNLLIKKDIFKICKFTEKEKYVFYVLKKLSYIKDFRNALDDYVHYSLSNFYTYLSKKFGLDKKDLQFLWDDELEELMTKRSKFSLKYIREKQKFCVAVSLPDVVKLNQYYIGREAHDLREKIFRKSNQFGQITNQTSLKGIIASIGLVIGKVKIVHSVLEINKVQKGDILVVGMTSPKYISAIYNSSAIITDDGGLTCHAAIIARELRKPCIIGTKIATQVLNDGDLVEVDANQGIVKILKKAK